MLVEAKAESHPVLQNVQCQEHPQQNVTGTPNHTCTGCWALHAMYMQGGGVCDLELAQRMQKVLELFEIEIKAAAAIEKR